MQRRTWLLGLIGLLVTIATGTGLFYQTQGSHIPYTSVRGEYAVFEGTGIYRYDPASVAREGRVWDAVNLFFGVPLLALAAVLCRRNSLRGKLLLGGLLFYFFYTYLMYAVMVAFNPLFLVYVAIFALCTVAFFLNLRTIDVPGLPDRITERFPRRLFICYAFGMSAAIMLIWLRLTTSAMTAGHFPAEIAGMNTLPTQAMDLGMVVPLMTSAGILLWRRSPWGYLLAGVGVSFALLMCIVLPAWIAVPLIENEKIDAVEAVPFLIGCVLGLGIALLFFRGVRDVPTLADAKGEAA